jgi:hypothetical protein
LLTWAAFKCFGIFLPLGNKVKSSGSHKKDVCEKKVPKLLDSQEKNSEISIFKPLVSIWHNKI